MSLLYIPIEHADGVNKLYLEFLWAFDIVIKQLVNICTRMLAGSRYWARGKFEEHSRVQWPISANSEQKKKKRKITTLIYNIISEKAFLKRWVFKWRLKTWKSEVHLRSNGRLFHSFGAAATKARSPRVGRVLKLGFESRYHCQKLRTRWRFRVRTKAIQYVAQYPDTSV